MHAWKRTLLVALLTASPRVFAQLDLDWAYHDDDDGIDDRVGEKVPGETFTFLGNGSTVIGDNEPVVIYVLTANQFAYDLDEQVFVRWWDGQQEHWIMGGWVKNIYVGEKQPGGRFHDQPSQGEVMLDLWKVEVPAEATRPGENYYVIQLKGWSEEEGAIERYLLREAGASEASHNGLNQAWSSAADFSGRDWSVTIKE